MKKILCAAFAAVLMLASCGTNSGDVLKEEILPDFTAMLETENENRVLYEEIMAAAVAYAQEPSDENKAAFIAVEEENTQAILQNSTVSSSLGDSAKDAMVNYNISEEDYNAYFDTFALNAEDYADWDAACTLVENGDADALADNLVANAAMYDLTKKFFIYGIMDLYAEVGDDNLAYIQSIVAQYPTIAMEDEEWLTDRDKILEKADEAETKCREAINAYKVSVNEREAELLKLQQEYAAQ